MSEKEPFVEWVYKGGDFDEEMIKNLNGKIVLVPHKEEDRKMTDNLEKLLNLGFIEEKENEDYD